MLILKYLNKNIMKKKKILKNYEMSIRHKLDSIKINNLLTYLSDDL